MKKLVFTILTILSVSGVFVSLPVFAATSAYDACKYQPNSAACADKTPVTNNATVATRIGNVLDTVYLVVGILAVIFIVYAGIRYVTSVGQPDKVKLAQKQLTYAIVGLIVALMAFAITRFVVARI